MEWHKIEKHARDLIEKFDGAHQDYADYITECEKQIRLNGLIIEHLNRKLIEKHKKYKVGQLVTMRDLELGIILEHTVISNKIQMKIALYFDKKFETESAGWYNQDSEHIKKYDGEI